MEEAEMKKSKRALVVIVTFLFLLSSVCLDNAVVYRRNIDSEGIGSQNKSLYHCVSDYIWSNVFFVNSQINLPEDALLRSLTSTYVSRLSYRLKNLKRRRGPRKISMPKPITRSYKKK